MADKIVQLQDKNGDNIFPVGVGNSMQNYSNSEQVIGLWNGETLYRRTFTVSRTAAGEITLWTFGSGNIIPRRVEAYLMSSTNHYIQPIGQYTGNNATSRALADASTFKIQAASGWDVSTYNQVVGIIEYTKIS